MERGSRRTRSQAAPDWTAQESLTLVNEIVAVEAECGGTMSSFQKWQLTVEHCNALDVCRSMDQCKRKWDSLLDDYRRLKPWAAKYWTASFDDDRRKELGLPEGFDLELFEAIDKYVNKQGKDADSDPDSDPEAQADDSFMLLDTGLNKQWRRSNTRKRKGEESSNGSVKQEEQPSLHINQDNSSDEKIEETPEIQHSTSETTGEASGSDDKAESVENTGVESSNSEESIVEDKKETMASTLQENAELINALVERDLTENNGDADLNNPMVDDLVRLEADKLMEYLGKISETLGQLCEIVEDSK